MSKPSYVTLEELLAKRPGDTTRIAQARDEILIESRAHRLSDVRKAKHLTQEQLAERINIDQSRVSRIENGDLSRTEVGTLAAYAHAVGGTLELVMHVGDVAIPLTAPAKKPTRAKSAKQISAATTRTKPASGKAPVKKARSPPSQDRLDIRRRRPRRRGKLSVSW